MNLVYLDNAASTKMSSKVVEEMIKSYDDNYANPSSTHRLGQKAKGAMEKARNIIAKYLNVNQSEIIFTSGGAEGNNLVIKGYLSHLLQEDSDNIEKNGKEIKDINNTKKKYHIITSKIEHSTVLKTYEELEKEGYEVTYLDVDKNGVIKLEQLENSIKPNTVLISVMYANNETGVKQPIDKIANIISATEKIYKTNILFHSDAVQAIGKEVIFPEKLRIDALTATAHKFYGPKGIGFVYLNKKFQIEKEIWGGSQERNRRAGTENVSGIIGMGVAIKEVYDNIYGYDVNIDKNNSKQTINEKYLHNYLEKRVNEEIKDVIINGEQVERLDNITNFTIKGCDVQTLLIGLDLRGICISGGSACMSGAQEDSHVLKAMGLKLDELKSSFRVSIGKYTTKEEIDYFIENLKEIVKIERGE